MKHLIIPEGYTAPLTIRETEVAIKEIKDHFERALAKSLHLTRVSAPLFVKPESGLNDNLNGVERPVAFGIKEQNDTPVEIVHSLAKWKRYALKEYNFAMYEGLYTDMNAIRRCEVPDNTHSFYVDQWDWEKVIDPSDRNVDYLKATVLTIFNTLRALDEYLCHLIPKRVKLLPNNIKFMTSQELIDEFPECKDSKEREKAACKKYKAIFLMQIGKVLSNGEVHDLRAPDYDDWNLNGDILVYNPVLDDQLELSSMGIRVDAKTLKEQLNISDCEERLNYKYHKLLVNNELPQTIGGGIGQSRLCMFFLQKAHIGEVQVSYWPDEMREELKKNSVILL